VNNVPPNPRMAHRRARSRPAWPIQRSKERLNNNAGVVSSHFSPTIRATRGHCCNERGGIQRLLQPYVSHANRSVRPPCRLERHSRRGLVGLNADPVEQVDRRAVPRVTDPVTAVIGPHQSYTSLADRVETLLFGGDEVLREFSGWQFGL
jgi:hypothetical protein